jgi:hypothetical protein
MKSSLAGTLKCIALLLALIPLELVFSQSKYPILDLGVPVQSPDRISYKTAYHFGKHNDDLLCWTTTAESGGQFAALNLNTHKLFIHPLEHLEAYPIVFGSNGKVYIGSTSGYVMVWDPIDDSWAKAGDRLFNVTNSALNHVRALCEGPDGWLYAGSCYGERAKLQMNGGTVEHLPKIVEEGNWYISAANTLPDGKVAFGVGYKARIIIYDPVKKIDVAQWMPEEYQKDGFCFNIISGKKIVYATHFPSGHRLCFDGTTGSFLGKVPWPDHRMENLWSTWNHSSGYGSAIDFYLLSENDAIITSDGEKIHRFHPRDTVLNTQIDPAAIRVSADLDLALQYEVTNDCRILHHDYRHGKSKEVLAPGLPAVERGIFSLTIGPDTCVYGGAYQSTLLFRYDSKSGNLSVLGDHHPGWSGETYSYTNRGEELVCASYTNGAVVAYDPFRKWDSSPNNMTNPRPLGFLGRYVYRPTDICVDDGGDLWAVGPAGWGTLGGGVAKLSYSTKELRSHNFKDIPHSLVQVTPNILALCSDTLMR